MPTPGSRVDQVTISPTTSIVEALARLDAAGTGALLLSSSERRLYGLVTDGDIRRAILRGVSLEEPCADDRQPEPDHRAEPPSLPEMRYT